MQFSDEQMSGLDERAEAGFVDRLMAYLRSKQTVWVESWPDDELRQRVQSGIARARSHGFAWESSLATFVTLMVRFTPDFDQFPPMRALLARQDVPGEARAGLLFTDIGAAQWQEAGDRYNPAGWDEFL